MDNSKFSIEIEIEIFNRNFPRIQFFLLSIDNFAFIFGQFLLRMSSES